MSNIMIEITNEDGQLEVVEVIECVATTYVQVVHLITDERIGAKPNPQDVLKALQVLAKHGRGSYKPPTSLEQLYETMMALINQTHDMKVRGLNQTVIELEALQKRFLPTCRHCHRLLDEYDAAMAGDCCHGCGWKDNI